ncbi:hypothetical protein ElyMa_002560600 [Elysia marginata]|uniref:Uncharacterized protein n=1 Tax=Elysia marginata TaxID=1093978 RepID=A0AAV4GWV0_9GAST|nr:hypothetical protein ElyMa_002560600 [Elysia marginata]
MVDHRVTCSILTFDIDKSELNLENMRTFFEEGKLQYLMILDESITNNGRHRCIAKKRRGCKFNFVRGVLSAAKQMKIRPERWYNSVSFIDFPTNVRKLDNFFCLLRPDQLDKIILSLGMYENKDLIKRYIEVVLRDSDSTKNMTIGQLRVSPFYKSDVALKRAREGNRDMDLIAGSTWTFMCRQTGRSHTITSYRDETETDSDEIKEKFDVKDNHFLQTQLFDANVKRKHYFFYSPPGYGKTLVFANFARMFNAVAMNDPNNFSGCSSDAQFIIIDEYGPNKRMSMEQLKSLTSGNPQVSFAGQLRYRGASFVPRNDVQVIILSSCHLFHCMGYGKEHKIDRVDADALRERFHIIKMDAEINGVCSEEDDAARFVNEPATEPMSMEEQLYDEVMHGLQGIDNSFFVKLREHWDVLIEAHVQQRPFDFCMSVLRHVTIHGKLYRMTMNSNELPDDESIDKFLNAYKTEIRTIFYDNPTYFCVLKVAVRLYMEKWKRQRM